MIYVILSFIAFLGLGTIWAISQDKETLNRAGVRLGYEHTSSDKKQQV